MERLRSIGGWVILLGFGLVFHLACSGYLPDPRGWYP